MILFANVFDLSGTSPRADKKKKLPINVEEEKEGMRNEGKRLRDINYHYCYCSIFNDDVENVICPNDFKGEQLLRLSRLKNYNFNSYLRLW